MGKTLYRCGFRILVDTREQLPYTFTNIPSTSKSHKPFDVPWKYQTLGEGDYSLDVPIPKLIAVERKSLEDLFSTFGGSRERFELEIERLNEYQFAAVVIEASMGVVMNPAKSRSDWRSKLHPRSVFESISAWSIRYPAVHWCFCDSRRIAEIKTFSLLQKAHRYLVEEQTWDLA